MKSERMSDCFVVSLLAGTENKEYLNGYILPNFWGGQGFKLFDLSFKNGNLYYSRESFEVRKGRPMGRPCEK